MEKSDQYRGGSATSTNGVATDSSSAINSAEQQSASSQPESAQESGEKKDKPPRTPGLKIFDVLLYPILTNAAVFGLSVAATYLTNKGGTRNAEGNLAFGKAGEFFQQRGEWLKEKFTRIGMTEGQADMSKMVAFSFIDGSLMAPVIKVFEDKREHIGRAIDIKLGTCPEDDSVYDAEPKQSWLSVLGGRLATVAIVVPTAVALDKTGLNNKLFAQPGKKFGEYIASKPAIAQKFAKYDIPELGKIGAFEAFYTSVCTAGIYFTSRLFASKRKQPENNTPTDTPAPLVTTSDATLVSASNDETQSSFASRVKRNCPPEIAIRTKLFSQRLDAEPEASHSLA